MPTIISKLNTKIITDVCTQPNLETDLKLRGSLDLLFKSEEYQKHKFLIEDRIKNVILDQALFLHKIFENDFWDITLWHTKESTHTVKLKDGICSRDDFCKDFATACMRYFIHHTEVNSAIG